MAEEKIGLSGFVRIDGADVAKRQMGEVRQSFEESGKAADHAGGRWRAAGDHLRGVVDQGRKLLTVLGIGGAGISAAAMKVGADMDSLVRSLASVSTTAEDLHAQMGRLREIAKLPGLGFEEAVQGSVRLQNAGLSARQAEAALGAFGNALALVGGGKAELDGVTLALTQMASKGKVSAEEINQINERVPQIRRAMLDAFGTADTEALGKMGIDAATFIERIVGQLKALPVASSGVKNAMENLGQSIKDALEPLGTGLVRALSEAGPLIDRVLGRVREISNFLGEGLVALVRSGVLSEFFGEIEARVKGAFGDGPRRAFAEFAGGVLAFFSELPNMIQDVGAYLQAVFGTMGRNIETIFRRLGWIKSPKEAAPSGITFDSGPPGAIRHHNPNVEDVGYDQSESPISTFGKWVTNLAAKGTKALGDWILSNPAVSSNGKLSGFLFGPLADGIFDNLESLPKFGGDSFANFGSKRRRWSDSILGSWAGIGDPEGLIFGGNQGSKAAAAGDVEDDIKDIRDNTRKTARELGDMRRQVLGGGDRAQIGATAAELRGGGAPYGSKVRLGDFGMVPVELLLKLDQAGAQRMIRVEQARAGGRGFNPR